MIAVEVGLMSVGKFRFYEHPPGVFLSGPEDLAEDSDTFVPRQVGAGAIEPLAYEWSARFGELVPPGCGRSRPIACGVDPYALTIQAR